MRRSLVVEAEIPSMEMFAARYAHYRAFAEGEGRFLFDVVMSPESLVRARVATEDLGLPAVAGIARICHEQALRRGTPAWSGFVKQYIGALTAVLMEANGFARTGMKRSVPHAAFNRGEMYVRQSVAPVAA